MKNLRKEGFTLIEQIAVLVIIAILALIVTPLVMNIIRKARVAADRRSIDAYGRSIELAIASYLLDTGKFPTEVSQLTIEYSGDTVSCTTEQINPDSSIYLADCKVKNRNVEGYTYGTDKSPSYTAYVVGNQVTYNGVSYYVIKDSGVKELTVTLLKAEPLTAAEVNLYGGVGTENNHVNMYITNNTSSPEYQKAYDAGVAYYSSETCKNYGDYDKSGCKLDYEQSEIKYVVDAWAKDKVLLGLQEARLITIDELRNNLGYGSSNSKNENTPSWIYNSNYSWWTMSGYNDSYVSPSEMWSVKQNGGLSGVSVCRSRFNTINAVRPVIVLDKSVLSN